MKNDLISRQAAIDAICKACANGDDYVNCRDRDIKSRWCDNITALRDLPSVQSQQVTGKLNADCISRKAAIDALTEYGNGRTVYIGVEEAIRRIEQLLPAQPEKRTEERTETHGVCLDTISRQAAIEAADDMVEPQESEG